MSTATPDVAYWPLFSSLSTCHFSNGLCQLLIALKGSSKIFFGRIRMSQKIPHDELEISLYIKEAGRVTLRSLKQMNQALMAK